MPGADQIAVCPACRSDRGWDIVAQGSRIATQLKCKDCGHTFESPDMEDLKIVDTKRPGEPKLVPLKPKTAREVVETRSKQKPVVGHPMIGGRAKW